ncbi:hypothetical protein PG991_008206 [Apiospora marii]|uniref:Uncharacterized protein n=1 Tax=Apiospora marii TaxID=335849 RepID=A0ABR1RQ89_9PEZI
MQSHLSRFGSLCAQVSNLLRAPEFLRAAKYTGLAMGPTVALVAALAVTHALGNVVLNVPQPPACAGSYKQLSVDVSAYYNAWDIGESNVTTTTTTQFVSYEQKSVAAVVAAGMNTTTEDSTGLPIQVPLHLDLGRVLDGNRVFFHVNLRCHAGPLTLSRRDHYYVRDGLRWNNVGWRPPVLEPLSRDSAAWNKWILRR